MSEGGPRRGIGRDPGARFALAVDLGTGGPKVGLVSLTGELAWHDHVRVQTRWLPGGGAVQDAAEWWEIVQERATAALSSGAVDPGAVVAVSVTGQWASTVPVGPDGAPVGDCILWMDTRGRRFSRKVIGGPLAGYAPLRALSWIRRSGGAPSTHGADPTGHMLHLQGAEPEVAAKARWFLEPVDYLSMCFSGVAAASHASMVAAWLTDNRRLTTYDYDPVLLRRSGIDASKLPPLRPTGSVIGHVRPDVAALLGLHGEVSVVTGTPDLHSAACGAGAVGDFEAHMAVSTSAWIGAPVPFKKTDPLRQVASVPGLTGDRYLIANNHETGGLCLEWLRDRVLFDGGAAAPGFGELTAAAATSPPGAGSVIFTPWLNGERSPVDDRRARAGFHNVSIATGRSDLARAVLEGVAFNNRWLHDAVEAFAKQKLDPIRMIGGGAESDLWCQIHADVMDRTIERVRQPLHANLRGAALFAGLSLGEVGPADLRSLVAVDVFRPDPANRAAYDRLYAEFPLLYKAQRSMFARLNR